MSHPDEGLLQELLDGELAPADEAVVRAHLAACAACVALLEELRVTQAEAASIVSRLELDPPLRRAAPRRAGIRRGNLRLLGLAASTMLVAGTSWLLFRTSPGAGHVDRLAGDSGRVDVGTPREERDQPAAGAPAPAAVAAPVPTTGQVAADEKKAKAGPAPLAPGQSRFRRTLKEEPAARVASPAPAGAANTAPPSLTVAEAESRLGWKVRTIAGLRPQSVELMPSVPEGVPGAASGVRQRYMVGGVPVVLVQQVVARPEENQVSKSAGRAAELTSKQQPVTADHAMAEQAKDQPEGVATRAAPAPAALSIRSWDAAGVRFELEGALPADSLEALMRRVR